MPFRPIVDFRGSPTYYLATLLCPILKELSNNHEYTIKNGFEFVTKIQNLRLKRGEDLVSYDVTSLFTKVPIKETLDFIQLKLQNTHTWKSLTQLSSADILNCLKLCVDNTYFTWRNQFYLQEEGTAMGSPISPAFCEIFLQKMESDLIQNNRHIKFYVRYVDDVYAVVRARHKSTVLNQLNSFHSEVQFTMEEEKDGKLPFLDVMTYKKPDSSIGHHVYRKSTHTDRYLHYTSFHHKSQKIAVIDTLTNRAIRISDQDHLQEELEHVIKVLKTNGYPLRLIKKRIKIMQLRLSNSITSGSTVSLSTSKVDRTWFVLPFIGPATNRISKILRKKLGIDIGYYTGQRLSSILCNYKDVDTESIKGCGIYRIGCQQCEMKYIGETKRDFEIRIKEHLADVDHNRVTKSAVALHMAENPGHKVDLQSTRLIEREPGYFMRKFKESLWIRWHKDTMNTNEGIKINPIWSTSLLPLLKPP